MSVARRAPRRRRTFKGRRSTVTRTRRRFRKRGVRRFRRRRMTRRSILNVTSRKKVDSMLPVVITEDMNVTPGPWSNATPLMCLFVPNARTSRTSITNPAVRNASDIFAVGYKERVQITLNGGGTFMWRRVVFFLKGEDLRHGMDSSEAGNIPGQLYNQTTEGGCRRVIGALEGTTNAREELQAYLFRGQMGLDWSSELTAPIDTRRVTVQSDRTRVIRPGNDTGASRLYNLWYPIRRTISYEDDLESNVVGDRPFSTAGLRGIGDMYIMDVMSIVTDQTEEPFTTYTFSPEGSFYWHER